MSRYPQLPPNDRYIELGAIFNTGSPSIHTNPRPYVQFESYRRLQGQAIFPTIDIPLTKLLHLLAMIVVRGRAVRKQLAGAGRKRPYSEREIGLTCPIPPAMQRWRIDGLKATAVTPPSLLIENIAVLDNAVCFIDDIIALFIELAVYAELHDYILSISLAVNDV